MKCVHCGREIEDIRPVPEFPKWVHADSGLMHCGKAPSFIATPAESPRKRPARTSR